MNVECPLSNVQCQMPNKECLMSNIECQMPNIERRMSNVKGQRPPSSFSPVSSSSSQQFHIVGCLMKAKEMQQQTTLSPFSILYLCCLGYG